MSAIKSQSLKQCLQNEITSNYAFTSWNSLLWTSCVGSLLLGSFSSGANVNDCLASLDGLIGSTSADLSSVLSYSFALRCTYTVAKWCLSSNRCTWLNWKGRSSYSQTTDNDKFWLQQHQQQQTNKFNSKHGKMHRYNPVAEITEIIGISPIFAS